MKKLSLTLWVVPLIAFGQVALTTAQIAKKVSPSVVVIQGKTDSGDVLGSGFIVSKDGRIVTNLHVIRDMKTASVHLANGEIFDFLSVLATDERRDLAIVKIAGFDLPALDLGDSDALTVGEPLVIVGSPQGLEGTVTAGILSSVRDSGEGFKVLQTDASVNPGNSGGPLVNNKGQAIGVVSFKLRSAEGLNFAVSINYVRGLLNNLHDPMTLAQMRQSLVGTTSAVQQSSGPSLKETLDWLKEKIPLFSVNYIVNSSNGGAVSKNRHAAVYSLDSCTGVFDIVNTTRIVESPDYQVVGMFRVTLPLGALTEAFVAHMENLDLLPPGTTFVSGDRWGYRVCLKSKSRDISLAEFPNVWHGQSVPTLQTPVTTTTNSFVLVFNDESIANRILEAFKHATALCQKKDIF
jgi:hypothetical protein